MLTHSGYLEKHYSLLLAPRFWESTALGVAFQNITSLGVKGRARSHPTLQQNTTWARTATLGSPEPAPGPVMLSCPWLPPGGPTESLQPVPEPGQQGWQPSIGAFPVLPTRLSLGLRTSWSVQGEIQGRIPAPEHLDDNLVLAAGRMVGLSFCQPGPEQPT